MQNIVDNHLSDFDELIKTADGIDRGKLMRIRKAIKSKNPDLILLELQKEGALSKYYTYWAYQSPRKEEDIKSTYQDANRPAIEVLIDQHVLISMNGGSSKIVWKNPNIINPQAGSQHKPVSIGKKQPDYNNQAKTARMLGVTKQAVQKQCREGGKVSHDAINEKGKINWWHPSVQAWKKEREEEAAAKGQPVEQIKSGNPTAKKLNEGSRHINTEVTFQEIEDLTIKEVVERYGGMIGFKNFVDALKSMSDWKAKETKYQEIRGKLVSINPVADSLFSILNTCLRWIVGEYPVAITDRLIAIAKSDRDTARIEIIELQEEELSKRIKETKEDVTRKLRDGGSLLNDSNVQQS